MLTSITLLALGGCSASTGAGKRKAPSLVATRLNGPARYSSRGTNGWQMVRAGDRLLPGCTIQTAIETSYLDISVRRSVTIRLYHATLLGISKLTKEQDGASGEIEYSAALDLRDGRIGVFGMPDVAGCEVSFTNGVVSIGKGPSLVTVSGDGGVEVREGTASVLMTNRNKTTAVPRGYLFDPVSEKIFEISNYRSPGQTRRGKK